MPPVTVVNRAAHAGTEQQDGHKHDEQQGKCADVCLQHGKDPLWKRRR
jgi:hypothetical protein